MTKRNIRLVSLLVIQVVALFVMIGRGIQRPWEITVAGGLVAGSTVTVSIYYTEPKSSRNDPPDQRA